MVRPPKECRKGGKGELYILEGKVYNGYVSNVRLLNGIEHWKQKSGPQQRPCWRRAWRPTRRRQESVLPTWGSAAIACCATAAALAPWRASIAMCSASRASSG